MFEEIPRKPRGFAGLAARRFVLGPFIVGGGVVLCTVGGSAALAATVITASTIGIDELPPHKTHRPAAPSASTQSRIERVVGSSSSRGANPTASKSGADATKPHPTKLPSKGTDAAAKPGNSPTAKPSTSAASVSATQSNGNAVVYIFGFDRSAKRIKFSYAVVKPGAAPDGGDVYVVNDPTPYSAGIAADIRITSGGTICPPAGSSCTPDELIKAADAGLFAQVAIDVDGNLKVVIEKGAPAKAATSQPAQSSPSGSAPAPSASPSAGAASPSAPAPG